MTDDTLKRKVSSVAFQSIIQWSPKYHPLEAKVSSVENTFGISFLIVLARNAGIGAYSLGHSSLLPRAFRQKAVRRLYVRLRVPCL